MEIKISDLIDYCFNDLPLEQKPAIEREMFTNDFCFTMIRTINRVKRKLNFDKQLVKIYFNSIATQNQLTNSN